MTGVEAVSNGVTAFREPRDKNARITLVTIIAILIVLLGGIAFLCRAYGIGATDPTKAGYQSVLCQLLGAVMGRGWFYYGSIAPILLVLTLEANTAFADFPRLCRAVAHDGYLPRAFANRGRRLVYSYGIFVLAVLAGGLLLLFAGVTDRLIPLFAVGAFLAFPLSEAGMVVHWRRAGGPHAHTSMLINGLGALATAATTLVVMVSKFTEGAWVTVLLIPSIVVVMRNVHGHYERLMRVVTTRNPLPTQGLKVVESPYRFVIGPLLEFILGVERANPRRQIAVILPNLVESHWYHRFLHNQRAELLTALLLIRAEPRIVIINVPWYFAEQQRAWRGPRRGREESSGKERYDTRDQGQSRGHHWSQ